MGVRCEDSFWNFWVGMSNFVWSRVVVSIKRWFSVVLVFIVFGFFRVGGVVAGFKVLFFRLGESFFFG